MYPFHTKKHESWNYLSLLQPLSITGSKFVYSDLFKLSINLNCSSLQSKFNLPAKFITIQIGVANNQPNPKSWPLQNWNQIVSLCVSAGHHVVLLGDKSKWPWVTKFWKIILIILQI